MTSVLCLSALVVHASSAHSLLSARYLQNHFLGTWLCLRPLTDEAARLEVVAAVGCIRMPLLQLTVAG